MKAIISRISSILVFGVTIYFIYLFFSNYNYIYLICGIVIPILLMAMASQYCLGNLLVLILFVSSTITIFVADHPSDHLFAAISIYTALIYLIRYGKNMTGNYIQKKELQVLDIKFTQELLNSEWFSLNAHKAGDISLVKELCAQKCYETHVNEILKYLFITYKSNYVKSRLTIQDLNEIHALAIISSLPKPIIKNKEGLVSTGTQMLLNVSNNLGKINVLKLDISNRMSIVMSTADLVKNSTKEFGPVSDEQVEKIKNFSIT